jgi:hypothetical protein
MGKRVTWTELTQHLQIVEAETPQSARCSALHWLANYG